MSGQRLLGISVGLTLLVLAACTNSPTAPPPSTPLTLEPSTLFSGGEGILVSESFRSIQLVPPTEDLENEHRRWANFHVLFAGDTVSSWRVSENRIAFRVPPSYSGTYSIEVRSPGYAASPVQARVIGATPGYGPSWGCVGGFYAADFLPLGSEELLLSTYCWRFEDSFPRGIVQLSPGTMFQDVYLSDPDEWIDELWFNGAEISGSFRGMWAPGPSVRSEHAVVERYPASEADSSSTWVWRFGAVPAPVERIDCLPVNYGWGTPTGYTAVEIAPGICLSMTEQHEFYLGGSRLLTTGDFSLIPSPSFRIAKNGTAVLRNVQLSLSPVWPVFRPDEGVAYVIEDYSRVVDVAFSPEGEEMYVFATTEASGDRRLVLDVRDTGSGALGGRAEFGCGPGAADCFCPSAAVARDSEHLWTLRRMAVDDGWQVRVELRDPTDLEVVRSVAVPEHLDDFWQEIMIGCSPTLLPDATGRRAYIFGDYGGHSGAGYLIELY